MAVNLEKGQKISLQKQDGSSLAQVRMGLGWDVAGKGKSGGGFLGGLFGGGGSAPSIDLDASCVMFSDQNQPVDVVYFGQLRSKDGSIEHTGDNRTGAGDGDDESLELALGQIPASIEKVVFCVTIHDADSRRQNFGQVSEAFMRLVNLDTGVELARFDLGEDYSTETAMIFGEIYRHQGDWKFRAVGQGFAGGLAALCGQFGVQVA